MKYKLIVHMALEKARKHERVHLVWDEAYSQPRSVVRDVLIGERPLIGTYTQEVTPERVLEDIEEFQREAGLRSLR